MKTTPLLIALIATASFAGGAIANEDCGHAGGMHMQGMHGDGEKMAAFHAKHLARLHGKLKLTAQQEPAWKAFTEKSKPDLAKSKAVREEMATLTTPARLDRMLALMKEGEARMGEHAAAVKEFYAQLTPEQQKTFDQESMPRMGKMPMKGKMDHKGHADHMNHADHADHAAPTTK